MGRNSKYPEKEKITDKLGPIKSKGHHISGESSETGSTIIYIRSLTSTTKGVMDLL
jgi:hypothetical protein